MSLAICFSCLLPFLFPFFVLAGPQNTTYLLPPPVPIPACARDCLTKFIAQAFPPSVCANQQDLNCLCTHNSTTGFTLGEGALQCVAAYCPEGLYKYAGVYEECIGVTNAQPETHGTLTATMQAVPSEQPTSISPLPASIVNPTSTIQSPDALIVTATLVHPTSTAFPSTSSSSTSVTILLATPTSAKQTFSSTTTPGATSSTFVAPASKPLLTKPQVVGIAVAGVASAALGFGLMLCILCFRKKRAARNRHSDASFGGDRIISTPLDPPDRPTTTERDPRSGSHWLDPTVAEQRQLLAVPPQAGELRWSKMWRGSLKPEEIGVAVAPGLRGCPVNDTTYSNSPVSAASYRTTSRLLPDKPSMSSMSSYSLFPPPLRINHANRPESDATVFEEDTSNGLRTSMLSSRQADRGRGSIDMTPTPAQRNLYASASDPFLSPTTESRALANSREQRRRSRSQTPLTPAHAPSQSRPYDDHWMPSPDEFRAGPSVLVNPHPPTNHSSKSLPLQRKPTAPSLRSAPPARAALMVPPNLPSKSLPSHGKPTLARIRPPLATIHSANSNSNSNPARTHSDTSFESGPYSPDPSDLSDLPYPSSSLLPPSSTNPEPFLSPVREAEENSARKHLPSGNPARGLAGTFANRSQHQTPIRSIRRPPGPDAFTSPHRTPPPFTPSSTEMDTPTRRPHPADPRRKPVELEGTPVYSATREVGLKASRSLPSLPTSPRDGGVGGGSGGRKSAKLMILQNPGLAALEGLHPSPARSVEELGGRR